MTAVMGDDERSNQKASRQNRQGNCQPPRDRKTEIYQTPKGCIGDQCIHQLPDTWPNGGLLILGDNVFPRWCRCFRLSVGGGRIIRHICLISQGFAQRRCGKTVARDPFGCQSLYLAIKSTSCTAKKSQNFTLNVFPPKNGELDGPRFALLFALACTSTYMLVGLVRHFLGKFRATRSSLTISLLARVETKCVT